MRIYATYADTICTTACWSAHVDECSTSGSGVSWSTSALKHIHTRLCTNSTVCTRVRRAGINDFAASRSGITWIARAGETAWDRVAGSCAGTGGRCAKINHIFACGPAVGGCAITFP